MKIEKSILMIILIVCSVFAGCTGTTDETTDTTVTDGSDTTDTTNTTDTVTELPQLKIAYSVQDDYENIDENPQRLADYLGTKLNMDVSNRFRWSSIGSFKIWKCTFSIFRRR